MRPSEHNPDPEKAVLASLVMEPIASWAEVSFLKPADFYATVHQELFKLLTEMIQTHEIPGDQEDLVLIQHGAERRGILDHVGGVRLLTDLLNILPTAAHARQYAEVVKRQSVRRQVIRQCSAALDGLNNSAFTEEIVADLLGSLKTLDMGSPVLTAEQTMNAVMRQIDEFKTQLRAPWLTTGFRILDGRFVSLRKASVIVIAGQTSMGKSTFLANMLRHWISTGHRGLLCTTEMLPEHYGLLLVSQITGIPGVRIESNNVRDEESRQVGETIGQLAARPLLVYFARGKTVREIAALARQEHTREPLTWLAIDYRDGLKTGKAENQNQAVSAQMNEIAALAGELQIPVVVVCQLNRNLDKRDDSRPQLSNLRDSGSIEQVADGVILLYWRGRYDREMSDVVRHVTEVHVAKQRRGEVFEAAIAFSRVCGRMSDLDSQTMDAYCGHTGNQNLRRPADEPDYRTREASEPEVDRGGTAQPLSPDTADETIRRPVNHPAEPEPANQDGCERPVQDVAKDAIPF